MGKHSNLILVDQQSGRIIDAIKRYSHAVSRHREVLPGRVYIPPPGQSKTSPLGLDEEQFVKVLQSGDWDQPLGSLAFRKLAGIGPELARELVVRATWPRTCSWKTAASMNCGASGRPCNKQSAPCCRVNAEPTLVLEGKNPVLYAPFRPTQDPGLSLDAAPSLNAGRR